MSRTNVSKCTALFIFAFRTELIFPRLTVTWISSVAIGAILGQIITNPEVDLVRGLLSLILLLTVDYVVTYAMAYSKMAQALFRGRPVLCVFRGKVLVDVCRNNR